MNKGSLIHSFHKLTFYVPGTVIGARYTQIKSSPVLKGLPTISWRGRAKVCHRAMPKGLCTNYLMPQWCWVTTNHITLVSYSNNCSFLTHRGGCLDSPADFGWGPWHAWRLPAVGWSRTASPWWHNYASRVSHPYLGTSRQIWAWSFMAMAPAQENKLCLRGASSRLCVYPIYWHPVGQSQPHAWTQTQEATNILHLL